MKKSAVISLLVSAAMIGLCGCASDSAQNSQAPAQPEPAKDTRTREEKLQVGMTQEEVRTAIGNPRDVSMNSDGLQTWIYNDAEKTFNPNDAMTFPSTVVIFDTSGKVKSWSSNGSGRH
jgi:outer membrane protein assembly factor BamE (lipoprotein component of BamABCDE complex)